MSRVVVGVQPIELCASGKVGVGCLLQPMARGHAFIT